MGPQRRNMTRRKPVPQLSPDTTTAPPLTARGLKRSSLSIINKENLPPLPIEVCEQMERTSVDDRRHAIYLPESSPPAPPPKDESASGSRRESLVATLVDEMGVREDTCREYRLHAYLYHLQRVELTLPQPTSEVRKRASQKSLPKIYRPPTPPIPAQHPKLRLGGHSRANSQDSQTHIINFGLMSPELQLSPAPCLTTPTSWPSGLVPDVSVTAHSLGSRSNVLSFAGKDLPPVCGGVPPQVRRQSAASASTANRASSRRSQFTCQSMCSGVWYAMKRLGIHLRVKMTHQAKY
ncbi:hypothetical protein LXA43DRAFT_882718 [Ganoderma leucocontextum]|nr:hypothetical protein LXA43DRAFT_882718 [Ganoderma leucocontextum]